MTIEEIESIIRKNIIITDEWLYKAVMSIALDVEKAERERIKGRVKGAAESVWGIRDYIDKRYGLYIGPSLNTLEEFVEKLLEEE